MNKLTDNVFKKLNEAEETNSEEDYMKVINEFAEKDGLHKDVVDYVLDQAQEYNNGSTLDNIISACDDTIGVNGNIGHLIYYSDTVNFYNKFESEIEDYLYYMQDNGFEPLDAIRQHCNDVEILMQTDIAKNWIVWFVYEDIAYTLSNILYEFKE